MRAARIGMLAALLAVVLGPFVSAPASAAEQHVMIAQYAYSSAALTVRVGDKVTWTNHDQAQHDVTTTSGPAAFQSPLLATGQSWTYTFTTAGSYAYYCSVHPDMRAQVVVVPADTPAPAAPVKTTQPPAKKPVVTTTAAPAAPAPVSMSSTAASVVPNSVQAQQVAPAAVEQRLDPMLLVAGVVAAVAVLCLLMIGGRPET